MVFSDPSTKQGIIQDITFLLGNAVDLNAYSIEDRTRNVNLRFHLVWHDIFEAYGGWQYVDSNKSQDGNLPYADQDLENGTARYFLPSNALTVRGVSVKNTGGAWMKLRGLTQEEFQQMGADANFQGSGTPEAYLLDGDVIRFLFGPNYSVDDGLRVYFDESIQEFAIVDTDVVPGFASPFHRILSIGGALDYALSHAMTDKVTYLANLLGDYSRRLKDFYSKRYQERFPYGIPGSYDLVEEFR